MGEEITDQTKLVTLLMSSGKVKNLKANKVLTKDKIYIFDKDGILIELKPNV